MLSLMGWSRIVLHSTIDPVVTDTLLCVLRLERFGGQLVFGHFSIIAGSVSPQKRFIA